VCISWINKKVLWSIPEFAAQAIYWLGYELDGPGFETRREEDVFFFSKTSKQAVVQTQPTIQRERGFSSGVTAAWGLMLAAYLYLAPRSSTRVDIPLLPLYAFIPWTGTALPFTLVLIPYRESNAVLETFAYM